MNTMTFANPQILWVTLLVVPLLSLFLWRGWIRRQVLIRQFVQARLLPVLTVGLSQSVQKARLVLQVLAVGLCLLALARPQWGFAWEEARQQGIDIVVAIDTSRSMLATDLQPDRLTRAKLAALDLMKFARSDRLGLVAFAGTAFLQCPLTLDDEAFRQSVEILDIGVIPQGGTALAEAIQTATTAFKDETGNHKVLVLFTDGEDHEKGAIEAAQRAAAAGLRIFTVGVGTPNGDILRERNEKGELVYVKDSNGNVVKSRLDEALLTEIATIGNGFYLPMSGSQTVEVLYQRGLEPLPKTEISSRLVRRYREQYQWFLSAAIALLVIELFLSDRKRAPRNTPVAATRDEPLKKLASATCFFLILSAAQASTGRALRNYEAGKYDEAERQFQQQLERRPNDPRLQYNTGVAAYQAGHYDRAVKHFDAAARSEDLDLQQLAHYNLGNTFYRLGEKENDPKQRIPVWEAALKQFEAALKLNPADADAQFNHEFLKRKLEELKQQQQQQQQDPKDQKDDQDKKDQNNPNQNDQEKNPENKDQQNQSDPPQDPKQKQQNSEEQNKQTPDPQPHDQSNDPKDQPSQSQDPKQEKSNADKQKQKAGSDNQSKDPADPSKQSEPIIPEGQMTLEQAKRLLDSQKSEEKSLIFAPPQKSRKIRILKDW